MSGTTNSTISRRGVMAGAAAIGVAAIPVAAIAGEHPSLALCREYFAADRECMDALNRRENIEVAARKVSGRSWDSFFVGLGQSAVILYRGSPMKPLARRVVQIGVIDKGDGNLSEFYAKGRKILKRENRKIRIAYRAECNRLGWQEAMDTEEAASKRANAAIEAIAGLSGTEPETLLAKLAVWRVCEMDAEGKPIDNGLPGASVHSAYEALALLLGYDPVAEFMQGEPL